MTNEEFQQTVLDWMGIEQHKQQERHDNIMAQSTDILAKITEMGAAVDTLKTEFEKAVAGISETVPAGHAAVLDTFIAPMEEVITKAKALAADIPAKVMVVQVPGAPVK